MWTTIIFFIFYLEVQSQNTTPNSTIDHPCTVDGFSCGCGTIWDSDCYCEDSSNRTIDLKKKHCRNCYELYRSCWNESRTLKDYNITDNCAPSSDLVDVLLITTSTTPTGIYYINTFKEVLEVLGPYLDFKLVFMAQRYGGNFVSPLGVVEIKTDYWFLCAIHYYPQYQMHYPFIFCLSQNADGLESAENCSKGHNLDYPVLKACVDGALGEQLLAERFDDSLGSNDPLIYIDGKGIGQRVQSQGKTYDFITALCYTINNPSSDGRIFPWWVFTFMACIAVALLLVIWVAKSDFSLGLSSLFCSVFYEVEENSAYDNAAREVLRLWQEGALLDEEVESQAEELQENLTESSEVSSEQSSSDSPLEEDNLLSSVQ